MSGQWVKWIVAVISSQKNKWSVCFKTPCIREKVRCHDYDKQTDNRNVKIELEFCESESAIRPEFI